MEYGQKMKEDLNVEHLQSNLCRKGRSALMPREKCSERVGSNFFTRACFLWKLEMKSSLLKSYCP